LFGFDFGGTLLVSEMTEAQTLLAEYARTGSETAFRELVTRYLGLVYSTALRLVGGDTHLAEDVAQTVFMDLARKARGLPSGVMLGGWLHQRTYNVAAPMMRARRRRQSREREAAQMNALQDDSGADLLRIAPMLDEAITHLGKEDRTAIILRFFERRDFHSIGRVLGSNEDAARMRVNRALNKLHSLLTHRGVALSAAALGSALASQSLTAAPAGLVAGVAGTVLASSAASGGISATLLKIMVMTKFKVGIITAVVVAGVVTSLLIQQNARAKLREQDESLRQRSDQLAQLATENEHLSSLASKANGSKNQLADLLKLRAEADSLRNQTGGIVLLREENHRLKQVLAGSPKTPLQLREQTMAKVEFEKSWMLAFILYAQEHQEQFPTSFEQAAPFFPTDAKAETRVDADLFEVVKQPSVVSLTNVNIIILLEKAPWLDSRGKWTRVYGMADGSVQTISVPVTYTDSNGQRISRDSFEAWEKEHMILPTAK
jgi:RNA polymerase sigma factor (sigma-70 family)